MPIGLIAMLEFVKKYGANVHSQNGEDGIISECVKRLGLTTGHAVEVGANDGLWLSNTRNLINNGWSGKMIEANWHLFQECRLNWAHNPSVTVQCSKVDENNINAFVDDSCDVLSLDTDGSDFKIFHGLKAKPKIVIVEIDSSIPPDNEGFNSDGGASYRAMVELALIKNYLVLCHTGNLVLVDLRYWNLFPEVEGTDPIFDSELYFNRGWLKENAA